MLQKKRKFDTTALLFIAPAFILFTVFLIVPTVSSFYYSFTSWDGINPNIKFIGFDNYKEIFTSARFGNALKNTALLTVVISICENALALGLALLVDNVIKGKNLFRAIFYLPVILSGIVSGFIWKIMYSYNFGPVNKVLDMIGLGTLKQDWLGNADIAIWAVALVMIWKGAGYYMIIYLAALQGVPQDVQEAATIDGASALQRFRFITLPLISGSFTICFTLSLINGLKVFDQIAVMTDGGPGFATETIVYLLYKSGFGEGRQGYGTAVGVVLLFIILILNNIQSAILRKREVQLNFRVSPEELALIEQKSHLVQGLSVVDNLFILREGFRKYFINEQVIFSQAVRFFEEKGLKVDLEKRVENLTELERCFVELGKALLSGCHLIIVDNPANYLSQYELFEFQQMLKKIRKEGISVLYVGNHHQELFKIADRTALFSDGHIYKVFERDEMTDEKMAPYISEWKIMSTENDQDAEDDGILHFHTVGVGNLNGLRFILHRGECMTILDKENKIAGDMMDLMTGKMRMDHSGTCDLHAEKSGGLSR